jgi:hypothetical protein
MSVLVRIGSESEALPRVAERDRPGDVRRRRGRRIVIAGACTGAVLLGAVPLPSIQEAHSLEQGCTTLAEEVDRLRAEAAIVRTWEEGDRGHADAEHREYARWFSGEKRLLETRNHVLRLARALGIQVTDVRVTDSQADVAAATPVAADPSAEPTVAPPPALPIAASSELCHVAGRGGFAEVVLLGAMLHRVEPPLRIVSLEIAGAGTTRDFTLLAERFYDASAPTRGELLATAPEGTGANR